MKGGQLMMLKVLGSLILLIAGPSSVATGQVEQQKILGSGLQNGDNFGVQVAVSGDWAVVGAPFANDLGSDSGAAYVFERVAGVWVERQRLKASDPVMNGGFGGSVDIEGSVIAIGSPGAQFQAMQYVGAIYVFELAGGVWSESQKLVPNDAAINFALGCSVALSGNRVVGGAVGEWHLGPFTGAAYIFESSAGSWSQVAKVIASDGAAGDQFGKSVALKGDTAVVGAVTASSGSLLYVGAAYVYDRVGAQWLETQKLVPPVPTAYNYFSSSLGIGADSIIVGAMGDDTGVSGGGAAYVYQHPNSTWDLTQILLPSDQSLQDNVGWYLDVSGRTAVISTDSSDVAADTGAGYLYSEVGNTWVQSGKVLAVGVSYGDYAASAAIDGSTILLGVPGDDDSCPLDVTCDSGSAFFFEFTPGAAQYGSCGLGSPCSNPDGHGGCRNSTGQGAVLAACGTNSVSADDLILEARWLPPSVNSLAFMGQGTASFFLGDGLRVVTPGSGSGLYRFPVHQASNGVVTYGPGLVASSLNHPVAGQIQSGQTWNFQVWYRNVGGPCGSGSNTTNGLSITFAP